MRRTLVVAAFVALLVPANAFAHASVRATSPSYRQRLERAPATVWIRFDQSVTPLRNSCRR